VIGEVVYFHIDEKLYVNGRIDSGALDAIGRLGGPMYTHVTKESVFNLARPVLPAKNQ
jgi:hypothetical protein